MYEIQGGRGYPPRPSPLPVKQLQGGVVGQEKGRTKILKIFIRREKSPTIKNYKILYSSEKTSRFFRNAVNIFFKIF
jgi:hypothetical protein